MCFKTYKELPTSIQDVPITPAGQGIPQAFMSSLFITPKFDPKTPLPVGTVKRKPKVGEIAISLTGSPLQVSPVTNSSDGVEVSPAFFQLLRY